MKAYKLIRQKKDGKLYPLFIDNKWAREIGVWYEAGLFPKVGFQPRKGYHMCFIPYAPHLKEDLASGEHRVWVECDIEDYEVYDRPAQQGGQWLLAQRMRINRILTKEEVESILKANGKEVA